MLVSGRVKSISTQICNHPKFLKVSHWLSELRYTKRNHRFGSLRKSCDSGIPTGIKIRLLQYRQGSQNTGFFICSMYGIFTYMYHKLSSIHAGKYYRSSHTFGTGFTTLFFSFPPSFNIKDSTSHDMHYVSLTCSKISVFAGSS